MNTPFPYDPNSTPHETVEAMLRKLHELPIEERCEAMLNIISCVMPSMSKGHLLRIRTEIASELSLTIPVVRDTLEVIDGHLAMREIAALDEDGPDPETL